MSNENQRRVTTMHASKLRPASGFTLIELMMVVTILGLATQIVVVNLPALIPSTVLDSEATRLTGILEFVRSEAQLRAQTYEVEVDLDHQRWRVIMPVEAKLTSAEVTEDDEGELQWIQVNERARLTGYQLAGGMLQRSGQVKIKFDHHGFTADQVIHLRMATENLEHMVWSIELRGLDRDSKIIKNHDGVAATITPVLEADFR